MEHTFDYSPQKLLLMSELQQLRIKNSKLKKQNQKLFQENEYVILSKCIFIQQTSREIEKLRAFISLLANALLGKG